MISIIGQCADCCECPEPTMFCKTAAGAFYTRGFGSDFGCNSAGQYRHAAFELACIAEDLFGDGACYIESPTVIYLKQNYGFDCLHPDGTYDGPYNNGAIDLGPCLDSYPDYPYECYGTNEPSPCDGFPGLYLCTKVTFSDYKTDEDLLACAASHFGTPEYSGFSSCVSGDFAFATIVKGDAGISVVYKATRFKFRFKVPKVITGKCYVITFDLVTTRVESGVPVDYVEPVTYAWDGNIPMGYDENDPATWPETGEFAAEMDFSSGFAVKNVVNVKAVCTGCA